MRYRQLGDSGIEVSEISLGSWLTFGAGITSEAAAACVDAAFDAGITFIDTANVYGRGAAEELLGEVLGRRPRDSYVLATKLYFPMSSTEQGLSRPQVLEQIDASLRRLRTDYVDLYQCHRYDVETPLEETMGALTEVVRAGKARAVGFSEWNAEQIQSALDLSARGAAKFVSSQPQVLAALADARGARDPALRGKRHLADRLVAARAGDPDRQVQAGRADPGGLADGERADEPLHGPLHRQRRAAGARRAARTDSRGVGVSMAQLALAWVLREPNVASAIVGASRPEQVRDNAAASGVDLDAETLAAIELALQPG